MKNVNGWSLLKGGYDCYSSVKEVLWMFHLSSLCLLTVVSYRQ